MANLNINGKTISVDVEDDTPLLWAIRENVGLTGTKYGCGIAQCGACTVHVDGVAMRSCGATVSEAAGKQITTIEGLAAADGKLHKVQQAWIANDVPQCGYCQSGMETGYRHTAAGEVVPRDIITSFTCRFNGSEIFRADLFPAIAANRSRISWRIS